MSDHPKKPKTKKLAPVTFKGATKKELDEGLKRRKREVRHAYAILKNFPFPPKGVSN